MNILPLSKKKALAVLLPNEGKLKLQTALSESFSNKHSRLSYLVMKKNLSNGSDTRQPSTTK